MSRSNRTLRIVVGSISMLLALVTIVLVIRSTSRASDSTRQALDVYGEVPEFSFVDQSGAAFGKTELLGRVSIANFIFTRCPTVCPVFTNKMQQVAKRTSDDIQLLSFSVDPEYDTPERLAQYAAERNIDGKRWHFLTGDAEQVKETVAGALKIAMERQGVDLEGIPDIVHGGHFVLFDGKGRIRGYYNSEDNDRIETMIHDATKLAAQIRQK